MKRKSKKSGISVFPILTIILPFICFFAISVYRYAKTGIFDYTSNFTHFLNVLKGGKEYIFPAIVFLTAGLLMILIFNFFKRSPGRIAWIITVISGTLLIAVGQRILFLISNNISVKTAIEFIKNGITPYSIIFSLVVCMIICNILKLTDSYFLKK